ncbi:MAG: hypothetical protein A2W98_02630 [Bacteroidetes bacterium GWF2_33_38]|nr:MAG: hypothetical protein A2W98_02630 [Bacteroidetes bacterium GWF2_33_38]
MTFSLVFSQDQGDKKSIEILNKVSKKMEAYTTIKAEFVSTLENLQDNIKESFKGTIMLKGKKYKLVLEGSEIFNNGTTMWTYLKEVNEVNISDATSTEESLLDPTKIFTMWNKDFKVNLVNEKFVKARAIYEIDLYPINRDKTYSRITLQIDKDKEEIVSVKYIGKDGNNYIIDILKIEPNTVMQDNIFTFDKTKYPKVEEIDMR